MDWFNSWVFKGFSIPLNYYTSFFCTFTILKSNQMPKIEIGKKDSAILQAKTVAYRDAYMTDALRKIIKVKFSAKTGHVQIVGRSHGKAKVSGKLHGFGSPRAPKNVGKVVTERSTEK